MHWGISELVTGRGLLVGRQPAHERTEHQVPLRSHSDVAGIGRRAHAGQVLAGHVVELRLAAERPVAPRGPPRQGSQCFSSSHVCVTHVHPTTYAAPCVSHMCLQPHACRTCASSQRGPTPTTYAACTAPRIIQRGPCMLIKRARRFLVEGQSWLAAGRRVSSSSWVTWNTLPASWGWNTMAP